MEENITAVKILGINKVKPWALFAKPLDAVPSTTAIKRIKYAVKLLILKL